MRVLSLLLGTSFLLAAFSVSNGAYAKDHSADYQMGTFISSDAEYDGTTTSTLHGDGITTAGSVYANQIAVYKIKVEDGIWELNTYTQNKDSMIREMGMTPVHFKAEKSNPLDLLKNGDRVLFRIEKHRLLNGVETSIYIPWADKPDKEFRFIGYFMPFAPSASSPAKPTDNVKAMCDAHKLSPELEEQFCKPEATSPAVSESPSRPEPPSSPYSDIDSTMVENTKMLSCTQIKDSLLSNGMLVDSLRKYYPRTVASIKARCPAEAEALK